MKKIKIVVIVVLFIFVICFLGMITNIFDVEKNISTQDESQLKEIKKENVNDKNPNNLEVEETNVSTYDVSKQEYFDYINNLAKLKADKEKHILSVESRKEYPYYMVEFFLDKDYKHEELLKYSKELFKYYFDNIKLNKYKISFFKYAYNELSIYVYNKNQNYNVPNEYITFDLKDIDKYDSYEDFIDKNQIYKERGY